MTDEKKHYECNERGFPSLCTRFRAFLNEASRPRGDGESIMGNWGDMRLRVARTFKAVENLDDRTFDTLVTHVPIFQNRGRRHCAKCHPTPALLKAMKGGARC